MKYAPLAVAALWLLPIRVTGENPQIPFWVATTQSYVYPETKWSNQVGDVEQVIAEDAVNYTVVAPDGTQLRLPKAYTKIITADEAAKSLIAERQKFHKYIQDVVTQAQAVIARNRELETQMSQVVQIIQLATAINQRQQQGGQASAAEMQQMLGLMQQLRDLDKPQDRRRIPNQNRYELNVR